MKRASAFASVVVIGFLCSSSCSSKTTPTPITTYTGTISDPAGDALTDARVAVSPDLTGATINITGTNLVLTITFAAGTLSPADTHWAAYFDTDQNTATGCQDSAGASLLGIEYIVDGVDPRGSTSAIVVGASTGCAAFPQVGTGTVTFPSATQVQVTIPLSTLGNIDGRMKFRVVTEQYVTAAGSTGVLDYMPNNGLAPGTVQ